MDFFRGDHVFDGDMRVKVSQWWDLEAIDEQLGEWLDAYGAADEVWADLLGHDPAEALRIATPGACRMRSASTSRC